jgi:hypothetical protein
MTTVKIKCNYTAQIEEPDIGSEIMASDVSEDGSEYECTDLEISDITLMAGDESVEITPPSIMELEFVVIATYERSAGKFLGKDVIEEALIGDIPESMELDGLTFNLTAAEAM